MTRITSRDGTSNVHDPLFRLSAHVVPLRYDLEFFPRPHACIFSAKAAILFEVREPLAVPTTKLVLHALSMNIDREAVCVYPVSTAADDAVGQRSECDSGAAGACPFVVPAAAAGLAVPCVNLVMHERTSETCELSFAEALPNRRGDRFVLLLPHFRGRINRPHDSYGLYQCSKRDRGALATHLEPTNSRHLYPCYDEPCFQSVFSIAVIADADYTVISNSPVQLEESYTPSPEDDIGDDTATSSPRRLRRTLFMPTPPIHCCITGFMVGQFQMVEQQSRKRGVLCRVVFPVDQPQHAGWFALDLLTKALDFFDDFFQFALPLKKLDLVALEEFCSLGMENYGMISILMDFLLVTETTTLERRQRITRLIGHEVCHHWFGNWASVEFWKYLWLKEGMCRYLEYFFADAVNPSWCMWNDFIGNIIDSALVADANSATTHPVQFCDPRPRFVLESFDFISYAKGAMLLRMLFTIIDVRTLKRAAHLLMSRYGNDCFNIVQFGQAVHDAHDEMTARKGSLSVANGNDSSVFTANDAEREKSAAAAREEECSGVHDLINSVLALAEVPGHPYLLITPEPDPAVGSSSAETSPGAPRYRVSQYQMPLLHRGILPYFVRQQRQRHGPTVIDLLTPPVSTHFEWDPAKALRSFTTETAFKLPLRVLELTTLHGANLSSTSGIAEGNFSFAAYAGNASASNNSCSATAAAAAAAAAQSYTGSSTAAVPVVSTVRTMLLSQPTQFYDSNPLSPPEAVGSATAAPARAGSGTTSAGAVGTGRYVYFNYGGSGACRCDYDIATWQRVFELAPYLKDEDRMTITITLAKLRNVNIGHFPSEKSAGDRSTLFLEWILALTQSPPLMHSFLWDYITKRLEELVYMTQNAYCSRIFCDFVSSVYVPLHQRCLLSFFPHERTINFQSHLHLSRSTVSGIMHLLTLCGSPLILQECREVAAWALAAIYPNHCFNFSFGGEDYSADGGAGPVASAAASMTFPPPMAASTPLAATERAEGQASTSNLPGFGLSVGANAGSGAAGPQQLGLTSPLGASVGAGGVNMTMMASNGPRPHATPSGATHLDLCNDAHLAAVSDALQYLVQGGDLEVWAAAAGITVTVAQVDVEMVERDMGIRIPPLTSSAGDDADHFAKLAAVLPAFLTLDDDRAFDFMADVLQSFSRLSLNSVNALLRNTRFLGYLLESRRGALSQWLLRTLIQQGATLCSNGHVITLFKASVLYQESARQQCGSPMSSSNSTGNMHADSSAAASAMGTSPGSASATSSAYSEYRGIDFMDDGVGNHADAAPHGSRSAQGGVNDAADEGVGATTARPCSPGGDCDSPPSSRPPRKRKLLSPELATAFDMMECNCIWVDYCGDHYERFLRDQRSRRMWLPCESQLDSRSTPVAPDLVGCDSSSPVMSTAPDGSVTYQGPVGGISI